MSDLETSLTIIQVQKIISPFYMLSITRADRDDETKFWNSLRFHFVSEFLRCVSEESCVPHVNARCCDSCADFLLAIPDQESQRSPRTPFTFCFTERSTYRHKFAYFNGNKYKTTFLKDCNNPYCFSTDH